jgi:division/cell wall cluster transcriptional repressor MraZ
MFSETTEHPLDAKFRVFVPKRLQELLERDGDGNIRVTLTRGQDGCLFLYGTDGYEAALDPLDTRAITTRAQRMRQRRATKDAASSSLDAAGRLLIGPKQRALIELEPNEDGKIIVAMVGVMNRIELWPLKKWQEMEAELDAMDEELVDE